MRTPGGKPPHDKILDCLIALMGLIFAVGATAQAVESFKTKFNPFTNKLDYVHNLNDVYSSASRDSARISNLSSSTYRNFSALDPRFWHLSSVIAYHELLPLMSSHGNTTTYVDSGWHGRYSTSVHRQISSNKGTSDAHAALTLASAHGNDQLLKTTDSPTFKSIDLLVQSPQVGSAMLRMYSNTGAPAYILAYPRDFNLGTNEVLFEVAAYGKVPLNLYPSSKLQIITDREPSSSFVPSSFIFYNGTSATDLSEKVRFRSNGNVEIARHLTVGSTATAQSFIGNGAGLTGITANQVGAVSNARFANETSVRAAHQALTMMSAHGNNQLVGTTSFPTFTGISTGRLSVKGRADTTHLQVQGFGTQTYDLFKVINSAGSNLFTVSPVGNITASGSSSQTRGTFTLMSSGRIPFVNTGGFLDQSWFLQWDNSSKYMVFKAPLGGAGRGAFLGNSSALNNFPSVSFLPDQTATNQGVSLQVIPRGTGYNTTIKSQITVFETDYLADSTNYVGVVLRATGSGGFSISTSGAGTYATAANYRPILFQIQNQTKLKLEKDGTVGIGTANYPPEANLHVANNIINGTGRTIGRQMVTSAGVTAILFQNRTSIPAYNVVTARTDRDGHVRRASSAAVSNDLVVGAVFGDYSTTAGRHAAGTACSTNSYCWVAVNGYVTVQAEGGQCAASRGTSYAFVNTSTGRVACGTSSSAPSHQGEIGNVLANPDANNRIKVLMHFNCVMWPGYGLWSFLRRRKHDKEFYQ